MEQDITQVTLKFTLKIYSRLFSKQNKNIWQNYKNKILILFYSHNSICTSIILQTIFLFVTYDKRTHPISLTHSAQSLEKERWSKFIPCLSPLYPYYIITILLCIFKQGGGVRIYFKTEARRKMLFAASELDALL